MKTYSPDWDKMWDDDPKITIRNILLILEATGMRFRGSGIHFEKIKHLLKDEENKKL